MSKKSSSRGGVSGGPKPSNTAARARQADRPAPPAATQIPDASHPAILEIIESISGRPDWYVRMSRDPGSDDAYFVVYSALKRYAETAARKLADEGAKPGAVSMLVAADVGRATGLFAGELVRHFGGGGAAADDNGVPFSAKKAIGCAATWAAGALIDARFSGEEPNRVTREQIENRIKESALSAYDGGKSRVLAPVDDVLDQITEIADWPVKNLSGKPSPTALANIRHFMERHRLAVGLDSFVGRKWVEYRKRDGATTREQLNDRVVARLWGEMQLSGAHVSKAFFHDGMTALVEGNSTNSALEFVNAMEAEWDGSARIDTMFPRYFGVADTELHRAWSRAFMLTMVRRVRKPGSDLFGFPILEAPVGGEGKSSAAKALVRPEWFTDSMPLGATPKDVQELGRGKLLIEFSELRGMSQASDFEAIKAMLTRTVDSARAAYGREAEDIGRMFSFIGTTNMQQYLRDGGGLRRFWPMSVVGAIDVKALARDRDQLWAEAATLERTAETTNVPEAIFALEREVRKSRILHKKSVEELLPMLEEIESGVIPSRQLQAALDDIGLGSLFASQSNDISVMMRGLGFDNSRRLKRRGKLASVWLKGDNRSTWFKYNDGAFIRDLAGDALEVLSGETQGLARRAKSRSAEGTDDANVTAIVASMRNGKPSVDIQSYSAKKGGLI